MLIFAAFRLDLPTRDFIRAHQVPPLLAAGGFISRYCDFFEVVGAGAVCLLVAWFRGNRFWMRTFLLMIIAACIAGGASNVIKGVAGRVRPRYATDFGWHGPWYEGQLILIKSKFNSFPSGHTAVVSAFFGTLFAARRRIGAILLPAVAVVAAARVYIGAHFLSDVVAATVLGFFTAWLVMRCFAPPASGNPPLNAK